MNNHRTNRIVGTSPLRKEGADKVRGRAQYVDDIEPDGAWFGATLRSAIPRGRIESIHFGPQIDWSAFAVVTARDIPGKNQILMILADQPCLAETVVNHCQEPILLLAHAEKRCLTEALAAITVTYQPMPAVLEIEDSETGREIIWGADNIFKQFHLEKGNVDAVWSEAAHIVTGEYRTGAQEHLYIENNGMIASFNDETGLTVWGSLQCPFYVHRSLAAVFDLPPENVRVIQTETGGAFGGKEDYPSILAAHAGLLSRKARRPIKMVYDRAEDMAATTKRHPSRVRHRTAVDTDGKLLAMEIKIATDGGAYSTLSSTVLSRATLHATGPYFCPNVRIDSRAYVTNKVPSGAFRGFGAPQSIFAIERHMDQIARAVGLSAEEIRRRNFLHDGDETATQQVMVEPVILDRLLDRALQKSNYHEKHKQFAAENPGNRIQRGLGIAAFFHGSGFTGSGERYLNSLAGIDVTPEGKVRVLVSSTEFGQGTNTILPQIAAEALGIGYDDVLMAPPDTSIVPNSGPTVASRTSMVVGKLIERASRQLIDRLIEEASLPAQFTAEEFFSACEEYRSNHQEVVSLCRYEAPPNIYWDDQKYQGEAYPAFAWAVYVAEVAVDTLTYSAEVTNFVTVQEVGQVLHPTLASGQIEGGVAQGIGYALYEKVLYRDGDMINNQMTNYIMPTAQDVPPIHVFFEQIPFQHGAYGAKGIGELPHDGPAPAILNAIEDATGHSFRSIPLLPEDIFLGLFSHIDIRETACL
uniref:Putative Aldehyde oxidase and xanthine dehydrogenase, molybdopterin binding n=1 Tax=mine drainage metagenome TaxID=410659 RepID=E6QJZ1_9ZZZZ